MGRRHHQQPLQRGRPRGAVGALCEPQLPDIAGLDSFTGELLHSAQWNHDAIVDTVGRLDVYQRTAPWVMPRHDRTYSRAETLAYKHISLPAAGSPRGHLLGS